MRKNASLFFNYHKKDYDLKLKQFDNKMKLFRKMMSNFESANFPDKVSNIQIESYGPTCLLVCFDEPTESSGAMIIEYMSKKKLKIFKGHLFYRTLFTNQVEWSLTIDFDSLVGRVLLTFVDDCKKQYVIKNLETNMPYFVRISCANIRGYGPISFDFPPYAVPSCKLTLIINC